jgi:hypothetical protein
MARHSGRGESNLILLDDNASQCVAVFPGSALVRQEHLGGQCRKWKNKYLASAGDFERPCYGNWLPLVGYENHFHNSSESTLYAGGDPASCEQKEFVSRNGKFLGDFRLAAIEADQQRRKDQHERLVSIRQMDGNLCSELFLIF